MLQVNNYHTDGENDRVVVIVPVSPLTTIDEFIYLSLACHLPFRPSVAMKMNRPSKMGKSWPGKKKKPAFTIPQRHIYFILKGRFEVTLQSFPSDIFQLDILWHFQLNIADIPAEELKACLKGTPALKLFLSLSLFFLPSLCVCSSQTFCFPRVRAATQAYIHYLLSVVDLHLQVLEEVFLIQKDYQKFYHLEYVRQTQNVWLKKAYGAILSENSKTEMQ